MSEWLLVPMGLGIFLSCAITGLVVDWLLDKIGWKR